MTTLAEAQRALMDLARIELDLIPAAEALHRQVPPMDGERATDCAAFWSAWRDWRTLMDLRAEAMRRLGPVASQTVATQPPWGLVDRDLPCGHRAEDACEACVPDTTSSLAVLAETHDLTLCNGASDCICSCTPCMHQHEGRLG